MRPRGPMGRGCLAPVLCLLASCGPGAPGGEDADRTEARWTGEGGLDRVVYICDEDTRFLVRFRVGQAELVQDSGSTILVRDTAAPAVRYSGGGHVLRVSGEQATLDAQQVGARSCRGREVDTPAAESRLLGYDYRAIGQEPGWTLEIDFGQRMRFTGDYGATIILTPAPDPRVLPDGGSEYQAGAGPHDLRVRTTPGPCQDTMSGQEFADAVEVRLDDATYTGCGEPL